MLKPYLQMKLGVSCISDNLILFDSKPVKRCLKSFLLVYNQILLRFQELLY